MLWHSKWYPDVYDTFLQPTCGVNIRVDRDSMLMLAAYQRCADHKILSPFQSASDLRHCLRMLVLTANKKAVLSQR